MIQTYNYNCLFIFDNRDAVTVGSVARTADGLIKFIDKCQGICESTFTRCDFSRVIEK